MKPGNGNSQALAGALGAVKQEGFTADSAANIDEIQSNKPEIDLESWSKLGGNTKPSREQKRRVGR